MDEPENLDYDENEDISQSSLRGDSSKRGSMDQQQIVIQKENKHQSVPNNSVLLIPADQNPLLNPSRDGNIYEKLIHKSDPIPKYQQHQQTNLDQSRDSFYQNQNQNQSQSQSNYNNNQSNSNSMADQSLLKDPKFQLNPVRYFIIKNQNKKFLDICMKQGICLVKKAYDKLEKILSTCQSVYLIFSSVEGRQFLGYAKMITEPDDLSYIMDQLDEESIREIKPNYQNYCKIDWITKTPVGYDNFKHITNPWNKNQIVNYSKECQEVEPECAKKLLDILENPPEDTGPASGGQHGEESMANAKEKNLDSQGMNEGSKQSKSQYQQSQMAAQGLGNSYYPFMPQIPPISMNPMPMSLMTTCITNPTPFHNLGIFPIIPEQNYMSQFMMMNNTDMTQMDFMGQQQNYQYRNNYNGQGGENAGNQREKRKGRNNAQQNQQNSANSAEEAEGGDKNNNSNNNNRNNNQKKKYKKFMQRSKNPSAEPNENNEANNRHKQRRKTSDSPSNVNRNPRKHERGNRRRDNSQEKRSNSKNVKSHSPKKQHNSRSRSSHRHRRSIERQKEKDKGHKEVQRSDFNQGQEKRNKSKEQKKNDQNSSLKNQKRKQSQEAINNNINEIDPLQVDDDEQLQKNKEQEIKNQKNQKEHSQKSRERSKSKQEKDKSGIYRKKSKDQIIDKKKESRYLHRSRHEHHHHRNPSKESHDVKKQKVNAPKKQEEQQQQSLIVADKEQKEQHQKIELNEGKDQYQKKRGHSKSKEKLQNTNNESEQIKRIDVEDKQNRSQKKNDLSTSANKKTLSTKGSNHYHNSLKHIHLKEQTKQGLKKTFKSHSRSESNKHSYPLQKQRIGHNSKSNSRNRQKGKKNYSNLNDHRRSSLDRASRERNSIRRNIFQKRSKSRSKSKEKRHLNERVHRLSRERNTKEGIEDIKQISPQLHLSQSKSGLYNKQRSQSKEEKKVNDQELRRQYFEKYNNSNDPKVKIAESPNKSENENNKYQLNMNKQSSNLSHIFSESQFNMSMSQNKDEEGNNNIDSNDSQNDSLHKAQQQMLQSGVNQRQTILLQKNRSQELTSKLASSNQSNLYAVQLQANRNRKKISIIRENQKEQNNLGGGQSSSGGGQVLGMGSRNTQFQIEDNSGIDSRRIDLPKRIIKKVSIVDRIIKKGNPNNQVNQ